MAIKHVKATINGQTYNLTYNSSTGKYEATVTAPSKSSYNVNSGHYYPVTVTAQDVAGNTCTVTDTDSTYGGKLKLKVVEKTAPEIVITYPTAASYISSSKPVITFKVTDADSGVDTSTIGVRIDSGAKDTANITKTAITGGYQCTYTPQTALSDGKHTIYIDAKDHDGNAATTKSVAFTIDTIPPVLNVSSPADGLITNASTISVTGTTNDATSSPVTVTVNGAAASVSSDGKFTASVKLSEGANTITVVSTDASGQSTTVKRTVTLDTKAPVFKSVTITPNPVDSGKTFVISVDVED